jgi:hypothetical protein
MKSALLAVLVALPAHAQVVQVLGGSSTLYDAEGASATLYAPQTTVTLGAGVSQGHLVGSAAVKHSFKTYDVHLGDEQLFLTSGSNGVSVALRGVEVTHKDFSGFVGLVGEAYSAPYFQGLTANRFGIGFQYRHKFNNGFELGTVGVSSAAVRTALQEVRYGWRPLHFMANAGLVQNKFTADGLASVQTRHLNAAMSRYLFLYKDRRATVNEEGAAANIGPLTAYTTLFQSQQAHGQSVGMNVRAGRLTFGAYEFRARTTSFTGSINERLTRRLTVTQYVSRSRNATSFNFGASYSANIASFNVSYNEMFFPFLPQAAFQKMLSVGVTVRLRDSSVSLGTLTTPTGRTLWTAYGGQYLNAGFLPDAPSSTPSVRGARILGTVVDEHGAPLADVAIVIGKVTVYSNTAGKFEARASRTSAVHVDLENILTPGSWRVLTCPATAEPGEQIHIILGRG